MRKLFRMKYEPCMGDCYEARGVLQLPTVEPQWSAAAIKKVMDQLVAIHQPLCGNENLAVAIDLDEDLGIFAATFMHYGRLEVRLDRSLWGAIEKLGAVCEAHFASPEYQEEIRQHPGLGHGVCAYGEEEALRRWMVRAGGLALAGQEDAYIASLG